MDSLHRPHLEPPPGRGPGDGDERPKAGIAPAPVGTPNTRRGPGGPTAMFELKYFAKIAAYEKAEKSVKNPQPLPPFRIEDLGTDGPIPRATRRFTRWFMLFAFAVLRAVWPVARIGRLVIVTRHADVCTVLNDSTSFPVPFGPRIKSIGGGETFALGLDG